MKKKIISMITLAAFALTLVPMAAFADGATSDVETSPSTPVVDSQERNVDASASSISLAAPAEDGFAEDATIDTTMVVKGYGDVLVDSDDTAAQDIYVWVENADKKTIKDVKFFGTNDGKNQITNNALVPYGQGLAVKIEAKTENPAGVVESIAITKAGTYTIKAGVKTESGAIQEFAAKTDNGNEVVVKEPTYDKVKTVTVALNGHEDNKIATTEINGVTTFDGTITVEGDSTGAPVVMESIDGIKVIPTVEKDKPFTINNTTASFKIKPVKGLATGYYYIPVTVAGVEGQLELEVVNPADPDADVPATIEAKEVKNVINAADVANLNKANLTLAKNVQFVVKNKAGKEVTLATAPEIDKLGEKAVWDDALVLEAFDANTDYVTVVDQPKAAKLTDKNVKLDVVDLNGVVKVGEGLDIENTTAATEPNLALVLQLVAGDNAISKLVAGDYTVRAYLNNGEYADVSFTVAAFDEDSAVPTIVADKTDIEVEGNVGENKPEELKANGIAGTEFKVVLVDKNGVEKPISNSKVSVNVAVANDSADKIKLSTEGVQVDTTNAEYNFQVEAVSPEDPTAKVKVADIVGSKVVATVFVNNQILTQEFVLTDATKLVNYVVKADPLEGLVKKNNQVKLTVEDKDDKSKTQTINAIYVAPVDNKDVKVKVNGKTGLTVQSDKETTVKLNVTVMAGTNNALYTGTFEYVIGEPEVAPEATKTAVFTIGAKELVVDNAVIKTDVAPFVQNNRTYVPIRVIGEQVLGAKVEWNDKDRVVTFTTDNKVVEMTVGSKTYKVTENDKTTEKEMDVAPVIKDNRTFVPLRFVSEELGMDVTPLYAEDGRTAGVILETAK